jgi:hypothetical protein
LARIPCACADLDYNCLANFASEGQIVSESSEPTGRRDQPGSDVHSVSARAPVRSQLAADVEAFLASGGNIQEVPKDYRADPPKRPESSYGRGSI